MSPQEGRQQAVLDVRVAQAEEPRAEGPVRVRVRRLELGAASSGPGAPGEPSEGRETPEERLGAGGLRAGGLGTTSPRAPGSQAWRAGLAGGALTVARLFLHIHETERGGPLRRAEVMNYS